MPADFLTEEQERRYGRYTSEPTPDQLAKYFYLDGRDRELIARRRGDHNRLGMAIQLGTVRFLGTFLPNPVDVPASVTRYVASQLGLDPKRLGAYGDGETRWDHAAEIRRHLGYRDFTEPSEHFRLVRWLYTRAWLTNQRPSMLFDLATAWLVERKILLPGVTVLTRLVGRVRDRASARLWTALSCLPSAEQRARLEALLEVPAGARQTTFDRLRHAPTRCNAMGLATALECLRDLRSLDIHFLNLGHLPPGRVAALARSASAVRAQAIQRMPPERRTGTLLGFALTLAKTACDDVLELFDDFVRTSFGRAERRGTKARLNNLRQLDAAALKLREACLILLDAEYTDLAQLRRGIGERVPWPDLIEAVEAIGTLARPPDDHYYERVIRGYPNVQKFLPLLIGTIPFESTDVGQPVLEALHGLSRLIRRHRVTPLEECISVTVVPTIWHRHVFPEPGKVDRHAYTFCVLDQLCEALHRRDVFVNASTRWSDPRRLLLQAEDWLTTRPQVCRALKRDASPGPAIEVLAAELDVAYRKTAQNLASNPAVRIEQERKRDTLVLTQLDALPEPPSLVRLREQAHALLPRVDLPDVLLEVAAWTGFAREFTHVSEGLSRIEDLETSVCAVLLAEACNIGLEPLVRREVPTLTRGRLSWVAQNYVRAETIVSANAQLVDYQTRIPLARIWGDGEVASADGLRFVVPVRTLNTRPNRKYFDKGRGLTYYNFTSDQFTGFHGIVIPGTLRDAIYILDGLLEHQTGLKPTQLITDNAGYSDLVFGLFWLLGFQFSPRLADLGEARFWRMDRAADYGPLNGIARQTLNTKLIASNWDDMLRVAGSLLCGKVSASVLIRALQSRGEALHSGAGHRRRWPGPNIRVTRGKVAGDCRIDRAASETSDLNPE